MPDDYDSRYEEILRRIQERKAQAAVQPKQDTLAETLNAVNALGVLETVKKKPPAALNAYGPKVFRKTLKARLQALSESVDAGVQGSYWMGAVLWHKPKGYGHYEILSLLGIWAVEEADAVRLIVGTRQLAFNAPVFNPESYFHHIRRGFTMYYPGEASPPTDQPDDTLLYENPYQADERLRLRSEIEAAVQRWREGQH